MPYRSLLALAICSSSVFCQLPGSYGQAASTQAPHTVRGTVVDSVTGDPIYRALVQIGGQYAMLTDHEGHFEFEGVTLSGVPPWAMKPGYFAENGSSRSVNSPVQAGSLSAETEAIVKLVPEAILSGTVVGQDGAPVENLPVQLKTLSVQDGLSRWQRRQQTRTNAEGQYRFAELEAGRYQVTTGFHTEGLADSQASLAYIPARYPPAAGGSASAELSMMLSPGNHAVADLNPEMENLFPVSGSIAGYGGGRGVSFQVETASGEEFTPIARFTARTGEFRVMLPAGTYQVTATGYLGGVAVQARREITVAQAALTGVVFTMQPYATIPIDIETTAINQTSGGSSGQSAGQPPPDLAANLGLLTIHGEGPTPFVSAQPMHRPGGDSWTGEQGPFSIDNVSPGQYVLRAQPPSPWYIASASCGGVDLTRDALTVSGGAACSMHVVLRNDSGSAHVTIKDSTGAPSTAQRVLYVYALPESNLAQPVVMLSPQNGEYSAQGMAPGRYLVLALDHREELPYRDPEAMRRYAGFGQDISVTANGDASAEVGVASGAP